MQREGFTRARRRRFRVTTDSRHAAHIVGNRVARQFQVRG
jgi:hypothetical protein